MSDITTTLQDSYRDLCIEVHGRAAGAVAQYRKHLSDERGQTAAEYMGILLVVAVIIAALAASGIDTKISGFASDQIDKISKSGPGGGGK